MQSLTHFALFEQSQAIERWCNVHSSYCDALWASGRLFYNITAADRDSELSSRIFQQFKHLLWQGLFQLKGCLLGTTIYERNIIRLMMIRIAVEILSDCTASRCSCTYCDLRFLFSRTLHQIGGSLEISVWSVKYEETLCLGCELCKNTNSITNSARRFQNNSTWKWAQKERMVSIVLDGNKL